MAQETYLTYASLASSEDIEFEGFYQIYSESIRASEKKTREQIAEMCERADYKILLVKSDAIVVGFSVVFIPTKWPFALLEYMAVDEGYRETGIGKRLFQFTVETVISERGNIRIFLEVDSDREPSDDQTIRQRRKRFYRKLGCRRVEGLSYHLPLANNGIPPKMDLMVFSQGDAPTIPKHQLEQWLRVIYQTVYGRPADDPRIPQMLATVADPIELR